MSSVATAAPARPDRATRVAAWARHPLTTVVVFAIAAAVAVRTLSLIHI